MQPCRSLDNCTRSMHMNPMLMRHRAVRHDTHAGLQRLPSANAPSCGQKKHTHAGPQRIPSADVPSCGQKRHTLACNEFWLLMCLRAVREGPKDALACKELRMLRHRSAVGKPIVTHQRWRTNLVTQTICIYCLMPLDCLSPQISGKRRDVLPRNVIPRAFSTIH